MYFPYLRGKQFELIALRELGGILQNNREKVSPIIEPVKDSTGVKRILDDLKTRNVNFNVIVNPKKGDLVNRTTTLLNSIAPILDGYRNYQIAIILDGNENHAQIINYVRASGIQPGGITLIHNTDNDNVGPLLDQYSQLFPVVTNVVHFGKTSRRYYRSFEQNSVVELDDFFQAQEKNADFATLDDSSFSEEHLHFLEEGFKGFGDYLTIGDNYSESGMLPFAVAIHISYVDERNRIRVKHFVSDSNDDRTDTAGKFAEALDKLIPWCDARGLQSLAIDQFRELHRTGHFPGLGVIKKLSIMHHIQLVLTLI
jgi:hypothetical protein